MWIWGNGNEEMKLTFFFFAVSVYATGGIVGVAGQFRGWQFAAFGMYPYNLYRALSYKCMRLWFAPYFHCHFLICSSSLLTCKVHFFFFFFGKVPKCISSVLIYILDCDSAAGVFVCLLEYPRSKRGKGTSVERTWVFYEESIWTHLRL